MEKARKCDKSRKHKDHILFLIPQRNYMWASLRVPWLGVKLPMEPSHTKTHKYQPFLETGVNISDTIGIIIFSSTD